jgi:hypothetical protein
VPTLRAAQVCEALREAIQARFPMLTEVHLDLLRPGKHAEAMQLFAVATTNVLSGGLRVFISDERPIDTAALSASAPFR